LGVMDRLALSDAQWDCISGLIIGRADQRGSTGRDNRMFVEGVLWIIRTGSPWRDLPEAFGEWNSVFRRFSRWSAKGVWLRMFEALADDPDFEYLIIDSTIVRGPPACQRAQKGGSKSGHRSVARRPDNQNPSGCPWLGLPSPLLPDGRPGWRRPTSPAARRGACSRDRHGGCSLRFRCIPSHHRREGCAGRHSK
jgi:transposase